mmetsp:Transcript_43287/g.59168  ORF Transcript_43287/g.59168 Transcript_43287/m.59168 type:complete len:117 (+) Transcript_43287:179-529(+)
MNLSKTRNPRLSNSSVGSVMTMLVPEVLVIPSDTRPLVVRWFIEEEGGFVLTAIRAVLLWALPQIGSGPNQVPSVAQVRVISALSDPVGKRGSRVASSTKLRAHFAHPDAVGLGRT